MCVLHLYTCVFHVIAGLEGKSQSFLLLSFNLGLCKNFNVATIFQKHNFIQLCERFCFELAKLSFYTIIDGFRKQDATSKTT